MPSPLARRPRRPELPILYLDGRIAEWCVPSATEDRARYERVDCHGATPVDLVEAAVAAREAAGAGPGPCVLALGGALVRLRRLTLPPLANKEQRGVLLRKAAAAAGTPPEDTTFAALCVVESGAPAKSGEKPEAAAGPSGEWVVAALSRLHSTNLRLALRRAGFDVRSVVPARWSPLVAAAEQDAVARVAPSQDGEAAGDRENHEKAESGRASIVVGVDPQAVSVMLLSEGRLRAFEIVEGDLGGTPSMAVTLLQELRGMDAYWRKESRGGQVDHVWVCGLDAVRAESLCAAVHSALPAASARRISHASPGGGGAANEGRIEALRACLVRGPLAIELRAPLPSPRPVTVGVLTLVTLCAWTLAGVTWRGLSKDLERVQAKVDRFREEARDLSSVVERRSLVDRAEAEFDESIDTWAKVQADGFDAALVVADAWTAFDGRALLETLSVSRASDGFALEVSGRCDPDPVAGLRSIDEVRAALEESSSFADVTVLPSPRLPEAGGKGALRRGLEFSMRARLEDGR